MMRRTGMALLCGLATVWLMGCNKPCATTSDCNAGDVCAAAICRAVACEDAIFAKDPKTGACTALSGCFLTEDQRSWQTCQEDPCVGLAEAGCVADTRCQPSYATPDIDNSNNQMSMSGGVTTEPAFFACGGEAVGPTPGPGPDGTIVVPGVNTGDQPKHGPWNTGCMQGSSRTYAGCRAVPQITPQQPCTQLSTDQCQVRRDCTTNPGQGGLGGPTQPIFNGPNVPIPTSPPALGQMDLGQCFDVHPRQTTCESSDAMSCLTNPACQAIGTRCYCPSGSQCDCNSGGFLGCESNDHLRRCSSSNECGAGERCDNDEDCIMPRTFASTPVKPPAPGGTGCLGACVPVGCTGMGEKQCNSNPSCDAGSYGTVCHPQPYCTSGNDPNTGVDIAAGDGTGNTCGCGSEFIGCAVQTPIMNIRPERSLLVRDAEIIDDPTFNLLTVLTQLAPAGQVDQFAQSLLSQVGASQRVASGATTKARMGFSQLYQELNGGTAQLAQRFSAMMATTARINRLDLATTVNCGEARISFAMTSAYANGDQRMTMIVEIKVPDDGNNCKTVAQRWADLSNIEDVTQRRTNLIALYTELLKPANLGQIRTNEFVNRTGDEPWELREFHIRPADGLLDLSPVAQTVDPLQLGTANLLSWLSANAAGINAGTAIIPAQFLAGSSTENGGRLSFGTVTTDKTLLGLEKPVNALACAGCHLTETKSPFVHIGERLGNNMSGVYRPMGRAVIDDFLQKELPKRMKVLTNALAGTRGLAARDWRPVVQARVH